ncbi:MAG: uracil-DNA glycosylase [Desulfotalea sp.]
MNENILADIEGLLNYYKLLGIDHYPNSIEIQEFLQFKLDEKLVNVPSFPQQSPQLRPTDRGDYLPPSPPQENKEIPLQQITKQPSSGIIAASGCKNCKFYSPDGDFELGKGGSNPKEIRLLVLGDWRKTGSSSMASAAFGAEEDIMLSKMLAAMELPSNHVFVSNLIKCRQKEGLKIQASDAEQCRNYLHEQIKEMEPEIICAMGSFAAKTLLGKSQSLSQIRGKFYQVEIFSNCTIPVLATYHPTYLLKNEEMKRPTWIDLQKIVSRLNVQKS